MTRSLHVLFAAAGLVAMAGAQEARYSVQDFQERRASLRQEYAQARTPEEKGKILRQFKLLLFAPRYAHEPIMIPTPPGQAFSEMEQKVDRLEGPVAMSEAERAKYEARLARGEIVTRTWTSRPGVNVEFTEGLVDLPLEEFLESVPAADWGINLAGNVGGEIREAGEGRQIERMVLSMMPGVRLDITKLESVEMERDASGKPTRAKVRWEVVRSDNGRVFMDVGSVTFEAAGPNQTRVRFHSAHQLRVPGLLRTVLGQRAVDAITRTALGHSFQKYIDTYRKISEGKAVARRRQVLE
ncbi:MAG: hypothetical protein HY720_06220 [Planctomycetes bacterium]|nr:hypothetical protein [Planctomycetota bacterium]